jgi:hypothetical protein
MPGARRRHRDGRNRANGCLAHARLAQAALRAQPLD